VVTLTTSITLLFVPGPPNADGAWLTSEGHKRPGMKQGLPLEEAQRRQSGLMSRSMPCWAGSPDHFHDT
jgi:hypothetical protein